MNVIYISGPMTGIKNNNKKAFMRAEKYLHRLGYKTVNPIRLSKIVDKCIKNPTYDDYMRHDLKYLRQCDAIFFLKGWKRSRGAVLESKIADELGLKRLGMV